MKDRGNATSSPRRRPVAAFVAALLALALAFMAFEPNALRSAFADDGEAAPADAAQLGDEGMQATEPAEQEPEDASGDGGSGDEPDEGTGEGEAAAEVGPPPEESVPADDPAAGAQADGGRVDSRAGPAADDGEGEPDAAAPSSERAGAQEQEGRTVSVSCAVTFFDNAPSASPSVLARKLVSAQAGQTVRVDVSDVQASPPTGAQVFDGWLFGGEAVSDGIEVDPRDGDVRLYPSFSSGHWLRYVEGEAGSGAVYVPSQFVGASEQAPGALPATTRQGYAFEGWYTGSMSDGKVAYDAQVTDGSGVVLDGAGLKAMLSASDVTLYAKWRGVETTYRLITWYENPDDEGYSYQGSVTVGGDGSGEVVSGETTDVTQVPEVAGFTAKPIEQATIEGDGSTVVHAYYDRLEYSVRFHKARDKDSAVFEELTITAKYGADIHDKWPKPSASGGYSSAWYTLPDKDSNVFVSGIGTMPLYGADYYLKSDTGIDCDTVYLVQDVDGSKNFAEYVSQPFTTANSPWTTADDYMPIKGFMVNAASGDDAQAIRDIPAGDKAAVHDPAFPTSAEVGSRYEDAPPVTGADGVDRHTLYFYYLRCQYDVVFEENGGPAVDDATGIYYEAPLSGRAPASYVAGETMYTAHNGQVYEFAGWYDNEALADEPFDFESAHMPAGNVVLYAKWEPARHLVQADPAGGEFVNAAQSTYFWVNHGEKISYIDVERHYVADDGGQFVYDYETVSDDGDAFGNAVYVTAQSGDTSQRYSRSENAYSLYGWYRADDAARAGTPFDFNAAITEDTSIVARWRAAGVYDIAYNPTMEVAGGIVTGDIDVALDGGYADLSPTYIMNTPENIESTDGRGYAFVGWQVVEHFGEGAGPLVDGLYAESEGFVVDSQLATNNTIHLQAVYEETPDGPGTPTVPADPAEPEEADTPPSSSADGDAGGSEGGSGAAAQGTPASRSLLPLTGDEAQMLAVGIAGFALLALGVALIARAMRRRHLAED